MYVIELKMKKHGQIVRRETRMESEIGNILSDGFESKMKEF